MPANYGIHIVTKILSKLKIFRECLLGTFRLYCFDYIKDCSGFTHYNVGVKGTLFFTHLCVENSRWSCNEHIYHYSIVLDSNHVDHLNAYATQPTQQYYDINISSCSVLTFNRRLDVFLKSLPQPYNTLGLATNKSKLATAWSDHLLKFLVQHLIIPLGQYIDCTHQQVFHLMSSLHKGHMGCQRCFEKTYLDDF